MVQKVKVQNWLTANLDVVWGFGEVYLFNFHLYDFSTITEIIIGFFTVTFGLTLSFNPEDDYSRLFLVKN